MKHSLLTAAGVVLSVAVSAQQLRAEVITPSEVQATSEFGSIFSIAAINLINGSGLDGVGDVATQLHDNTDTNMWFSGCGDGGIPGGTPPECPTGFEIPPVDEQIVEFTLDAAYDLQYALVWQYNENNPNVGPLPGRGVKTFEMAVSPGLTGAFQSLGVFGLAAAVPDPTPGVFSEPAQMVPVDELPGTDVVQRVRFHIIEAQSGVNPDYVGLSEVRFQGAPSLIFSRGDCNADGEVGLPDVITVLDLTFSSGVVVGCRAACDMNADGVFDVTTAVHLINYLFLGGPPPTAPFLDCGPGQGSDLALGCNEIPQACAQ